MSREASGITLDLGHMLEASPGAGGSSGVTHRVADYSEKAAAAARSRGEAGEMAFLALANDRELLAGVERCASVYRGGPSPLEDVVVLGIGGSALGTRALARAIMGPSRCEEREEGPSRPNGRPRLHVLDNPDPDSVARVLSLVDPARTVFNVVSKSGSTVETLALYLVVRAELERRMSPEAARDRFVFTTAPRGGTLGRIAKEHGITALSVPPAVGGRFSTLSAVGLFPLALAGVDVASLLEGAAAMAARCTSGSLENNPAAELASHLYHAEVDHGRRVVVFMPYGDRLADSARFFQQLWAESLGKRPERGPTPLAAWGPADQHSLLQLFVEGPRDKVVVFMEIGVPSGSARPPGERPPGERIGQDPIVQRDLPGLAGRTLQDLMAIERRATAESLARHGCPNTTIVLDGHGERTLGEFVMLVQVATVMAGALYGVDPYGQPGVEEVKQLVRRYLRD